MTRYLFICVCLLCACRKAPTASIVTTPVVDPAEPMAKDLVRDQALKDLQADLATIKMQLGIATGIAQAAALNVMAPSPRAAMYTCDRMAIAQRVLSEDPRAQVPLAEAETFCAYKVPLAATTEHLALAHADCSALSDFFHHVGTKFRADAAVVDAFARARSLCPHLRLGPEHLATARGSRSIGSASPSAEQPAKREACLERCRETGTSCRFSCQYCGSCTTDKTQEWCQSTCNTCRQGCEQNIEFCKASCGS